MQVYWRDNVKARQQGAGLTYERLTASPGERFDAQAYFLDQLGKRKRPDLDTKPVVIKAGSKLREQEQTVGQQA